MKLKREFIYDPNLVLYLPLWKLDGASFMSQDAYGRLCTITGATWGITGRIFAGGDDRIVISPAISLANATPWTIEAIVYLTTQETANPILGHSSSSGKFEWRANNQLYFYDDTGANNYGTFSSSMLNRWVQAAITCNGAGLVNFYEDTILLVTRTYAATAFTIDSMGYTANGAAWGSGIHGEFRIYTRLLSQSELARNRKNTIWKYA